MNYIKHTETHPLFLSSVCSMCSVLSVLSELFLSHFFLGISSFMSEPVMSVSECVHAGERAFHCLCLCASVVCVESVYKVQND